MAWLQVCGEENHLLEETVGQRSKERQNKGKYSKQDVQFIKRLTLPVCVHTLQVSPMRLEKIRALCREWEVDISPLTITSHRKIIGPVIVAAKKAMFPLLRMLLKDFVRKQRDFNAKVIEALIEYKDEEKLLK